MTKTVYDVVMYDYYTKETEILTTVEDEDYAEYIADMCMDRDIMEGCAGRFLYSVEDAIENEEEDWEEEEQGEEEYYEMLMNWEREN